MFNVNVIHTLDAKREPLTTISTYETGANTYYFTQKMYKKIHQPRAPVINSVQVLFKVEFSFCFFNLIWRLFKLQSTISKKKKTMQFQSNEKNQ